MKKIPFLNLKDVHLRYADELKEAACKAIDSGIFIDGNKTNEFERAYAEFCGVDACIGTGNGYDSLFVILKGMITLGYLQEGDRVAVPENTFIATALAVINSRLNLLPVKVNKHTYCVDVESVDEAVKKGAKCLIAVHLYGYLADIEDVFSASNQAGIYLIEDAAQSHGAVATFQKAGSFGIASAFSFYPGKNLGAIGDAGCILTSNAELEKFCRMYRNYGSTVRYCHEVSGINSRLDEIQASILLVRLRYIDEENSARREVANHYLKGIKNEKISIRWFDHYIKQDQQKHVFHLFVIEVTDREKFIEYMDKCGISVLIHYPRRIQEHKAFSSQLWFEAEVVNNLVSLPISPSLSKSEIRRIISCVNDF